MADKESLGAVEDYQARHPISERARKEIETIEEKQKSPLDLWGEDSSPYVREEPKIGRNDPCPCGSGKKYKKCCMRKDQE